MNFPIFVA